MPRPRTTPVPRLATARGPRRRHAGFTLLEAVLVIAMTGVVGAIVAVFVRGPITSYVDQARRAELTDTASLALRRMARELQRALPNSVRVGAGGAALEFLPVSDAGRYRAAPDADGHRDALDLDSATDHTFDVLGGPVAVAPGEQLVVFNLGLPGADAWAGDTRRALASTGAALTRLDYVLGGAQLPWGSPGQRFHVVAPPVTFLCDAASRTLRRYGGYAIQATQPTAPSAGPLAGAASALLATNATCSFRYDPAVAPRHGLVTLVLTLADGGESITLLHEVHVDNSP